MGAARRPVYLADRRRALKLTQAKLAEISGIPQNRISRLEREVQGPSAGVLLALAKALKIDPFLLRFARPEPKPRRRTDPVKRNGQNEAITGGR